MDPKEAHDMSTRGEGTTTTFTSVLVSTLDPLGTSIVPPHPSTIATSIGLVLVFQEFLQSFVDS